MRALSIRQPWAALVKVGAKQIETRSWSTAYRGALAIHAPRAATKADFMDPVWAHCTDPLDVGLLRDDLRPLTFGAVLAMTRLVDCLPVIVANDPYEPDTDFCMVRSLDGNRLYHKVGNTVADMTDQLPFGDFSPGRWAWMLWGTTQLDEPIPARGRQGLWEWPDGDSVMAAFVRGPESKERRDGRRRTDWGRATAST